MTLSIASIAGPKEFVLEAERALAAAPPAEYAAVRRGFIGEATVLFGPDASREVDDALPDHPPSSPAVSEIDE